MTPTTSGNASVNPEQVQQQAQQLDLQVHWDATSFGMWLVRRKDDVWRTLGSTDALALAELQSIAAGNWDQIPKPRRLAP